MSAPDPALRMTQRDDGLGVRGHARLNVSTDAPNRPTSVQAGHAPRLGTNGRYA